MTEATHGVWYSPEHKRFQIGALELFNDADAAIFCGSQKICEALLDDLNVALDVALLRTKKVP